MIRFLVKQYQFGCRVGLGPVGAVKRAVTLYRKGF